MDKERYFILLAYDGTAYSGWQMQNNAVTIQEKIEQALQKLLSGSRTVLEGCGRTDAGVHAAKYVAHFDTDRDLDTGDFAFRLNNVLPDDICIYEIQKVSRDHHARFSANERTYKYLVDTGHPLFYRDRVYSARLRRPFELEPMQEAAQLLLEYDEFFTFCKAKADVNHYGCDLRQSEWEQVGPKQYVYTVRSNRFMRGMVRLIVGMSLRIGWKQIEIDEVRAAMDAQRPMDRPWSVPPEGLFLWDVQYPGKIFKRDSTYPVFFPL